MKFKLLFFLIFFNFYFFSQKIRVGIFTDQKVESIGVIVTSGSYDLISDSLLKSITSSDTVDFKIENKSNISIYLNHIFFINIEKIKLVQSDSNSIINFKPYIPNLKSRSYEGDFELVISNGFLRLVNTIEIDSYLKGVLESESGSHQPLEYYKAQAIISRTYAIKNFKKHAKDNFNLCDRTHCQAYLNKRKAELLIDSAIINTKGILMQDNNNALAPTFFHANCGGQTSETDLVWREKIVFLKSIKDTFCTKTKQAKWEKRISLEKWCEFLDDKYNFPINDSASIQLMNKFKQPSRLTFYLDSKYGIPLTSLRQKFNLKSTFFSTEISGEDILLRGRGFGHGVGLCQEGAMEMAKQGFLFNQILDYYYKGMNLVYVKN